MLLTVRLGPEELDRAVEIVRAGGVLAFPTDTVYGLGCRDVERLYQAKGRPREKLIAYLVASSPAEFPEPARRLAQAFWPGALTIVSGEDAFRMPDHPLPLALLGETGPLPTTSANRSGSPATADPDEVWSELGDRIAALLDGGICPGGQASTVVDLDGTIIREGAISAARVLEVLARG
ncbi:MAG: L-threonylcarbamoyladenylate synthase [Chloroflexota bacterium]|nr:L-threonylcarbamoyladenylate synthase [Chloroflexota bacterium]